MNMKVKSIFVIFVFMLACSLFFGCTLHENPSEIYPDAPAETPVETPPPSVKIQAVIFE